MNEIILNRFETLGPVGRGAYGQVSLIRDHQDPQRPLLIIKKFLTATMTPDALRELAIHLRMNHPRIIKLLFIVPRTSGSAQLIMQAAPMDLRCFVNGFFCTFPVVPPTAPTLSPGVQEGFQPITPTPTDVEPEDAASPVTCNRQASDDVDPTPVPVVPLKFIKSIIKQLLEGCEYMHERGVIHRDLKPENIFVFPFGERLPEVQKMCLSPLTETPLSAEKIQGFIHAHSCCHRDKCQTYRTCQEALRDCARLPSTVNPEVKIGDFGSSRLAGFNWMSTQRPHHNTDAQEQQMWDRIHTGGVTTRCYVSPEAGMYAAYSFPADMWAIGCIMFEMTIGRLCVPITKVGPAVRGAFVPVDDNTQWYHLVRMLEVLGVPTREDWLEIAGHYPGAVHMLQGVPLLMGRAGFLQYHSALFRQLLTDDGFDLLCGLLTWSPSKRLTAKDALHHPFVCPDATTATDDGTAAGAE